MKHIIIGGVAGGATAAARIRRIDEKAEIILIERRHHISYANCGLPYYIGEIIKERDKLFVQNAQKFKQRFNIDVYIQTEATQIDTTQKTVTVRLSNGKEQIFSYDKLLLSPGASPFRPNLPGIQLPGVFALRNVSDTDQIKAYIDALKTAQEAKQKKALIVGAGFIGLEMAENLSEQGFEVTIVEMANQVMVPVDFCIASFIQEHLLDKGLQLQLNEQVRSFKHIEQKNRTMLAIKLASGKTLTSDLVILSMGVRPETALAEQAGIKLGKTGGIWVDKYLRTSIPDVYSVGDAIEYPHPVTKQPWLNYLAGPANRQARIAATNMVRGDVDTYEGAIGTSIAKVFDRTVAITGLNSKRLSQTDLSFMTTITVRNSNANYYPGGTQMVTKLTYSTIDGQLYGAQIVGEKGIDKRIDQLSILIKNKGTVRDLMEIEQAYAPPFSAAKDPIAIAGYVATNALTGEMPVMTWKQLYHEIHGQGHINYLRVLDIRTPEEFESTPIAGSINIPLDELRNRINELDPNQPTVVFCRVGLRAYLALNILKAHGFKEVYNLTGGVYVYHPAVRVWETNHTSINKNKINS